MKVENKKEDIKKLPLILTKKKITLSSKIIEKKEPKVDVKKISDLPSL